MRRIAILLAAVGALLLVPAASAFANGTVTVAISGGGAGEVSGVGGYQGESGLYESIPPIECTYASPGPAAGVCNGELEQQPEEFLEGAVLHAVPAPGSVFTGWEVTSGESIFPCEKEPECGLLTFLEEETSFEITANFEPANLTLNIEEGEGTVVSNPAGLECTGSAPHRCDAIVAEGPVTLTASPASGYIFKSWKKCDTGGVNGRQCTVAAGSSLKEIGAKFVKVWKLKVSKAGSGTGKAQTSPGGILCLYNCSSAEAVFKEGSVTVKQAAAKHNHFVQWTGACTGSEPTCTVSMTEGHSVEAEFAPDTQYTLSFSKTGGGQGSVKSKPSGLLCGYTCNSQAASYYEGETIEIEVKLNKGTTKLEWFSGAGTCTGSTEAAVSTCTVPMSEAKTLVAKFS